MASEGSYHVFFRPDIGPALHHFFGAFGERVNLPEGGNALYLSCSKVVADQPVYLEVILNGPENEPPVPLRIPHQLVLAISGPMDQAPAGFIGR